jgi:hypothetical protein
LELCPRQHIPRKPSSFISSTAEQLKAYRKAAEQGARTARCLPETFELWPARDNPPLKECLERVAAADALVVTVAHRFGWVPQDPPGDGRKSVTWPECEAAIRAGKEVLAFVVDDNAAWPEEAKEEYALVRAVREGRLDAALAAEVQRNVDQLRAFKAWLRGRGIQNTFVSPEDLRGKVAIALHEWKTRHPIFEGSNAPEAPRDPGPYLESLRDETGFIEIRGLQVGEGKARRFPIEDLYTPLMDEIGQRVDRQQAEQLGLAHTDQQSLEQALAANTRLVITGDPGAGKSTFLKWLVHRHCELRQRTGQDAPFPLLIRVSDLAEFLDKPCEQKDHAHSAMWIVRFLGAQCGLHGLDESFFLGTLRNGPCLLALDGLDEAPGAAARERVAGIVEDAARNWPNTRVLVTTRPQAYEGDAVLPRFAEARIGLDTEAVRMFLRRWSEALFPESAEKSARHATELVDAVESRMDIRRIAQNPVMLTALAVLHWNEKRLPEQRADLYESILTWLSRSRRQRLGRPAPERCIALLQELARAMQEHPKSRQVQAPRQWAAEVIAPRFREISAAAEQRERAEQFLAEEELDSGIVVGRGNEVRFWHLTFQEYLAARALAAETDWRMLFAGGRGWLPEWREVLLLLAGILHAQRVERVDALVSSALDAAVRTGLGSKLLGWLGVGPGTVEQARRFALLGAMMRDLEPLKYKPSDPRLQRMARAVMGIFDKGLSAAVPLKVRVEAAEALGRVGDPRLRENNWVRIPAGSFVMREGGKEHEVEMDAFEIGRYPVTVEEYSRYIEKGGRKPWDWEYQVQYPNRPVVNVSWEEAAAYCAWAGVHLPTEAQWERAARGQEGRPYPWGKEEPDRERANYWDSDIRSPTPVGLFPAGATPDGIHDLAGNVWEWVADWYGEYPRGGQRNPAGV